jgi:hypothetical protein
MSACPPHFFSRNRLLRGLANGHRMTAQALPRRQEIKPLASSVGAAAFLFVPTPSTPHRLSDPARVYVKEPIENQANRHFQT